MSGDWEICEVMERDFGRDDVVLEEGEREGATAAEGGVGGDEYCGGGCGREGRGS